MTITLHTLEVTGPGKRAAILELNGESHLIFGPTDTGKSYIVECLRFCLGGGEKPKNVGYSEGYSKAVLQISLANDQQFSVFRDLVDGSERVFPGFHKAIPQTGPTEIAKGISELVPEWCDGNDKKILTKAGKLGNLTAGDLRRISIFDEIETLNNVSFEGKDTNLKTRNKSALALVLRGSDDSDMLLPPSTNERNVAKGHVDAIKEQIASLVSDIPRGLTLQDAREALVKVTEEIERIDRYVRSHSGELAKLKRSRLKIEKESLQMSRRITSLQETQEQFELLDRKYVSDQQRLKAIATAASFTANFESRPCPLCGTDIQHQERHEETDAQTRQLRLAALAEIEKIVRLREGLRETLHDVRDDFEQCSNTMTGLQEDASENDRMQNELMEPANFDAKNEMTVLSDRKTELSVAANNLVKIDQLRDKLEEFQAKTKRKKQVVDRDMSKFSLLLCRQIKTLLTDWNVPDVESVYFDDELSDIEINQRKRTSFGKGKRGIFLTAYMVALMENALTNNHPHLGVVVIDSPVVTYKDPKHAENPETDDLLDENVKDRFYAWLAARKGPGQVIILENEEPKPETLTRLRFTEFVGRGATSGRVGFFPVPA